MTNTKEEFETDDIYLAAYFMVSGCELERRRTVGQKVIFIFTNSGGSIKELRESYYSGKASVKAHQYSTAIVSAKKLCFNG